MDRLELHRDDGASKIERSRPQKQHTPRLRMPYMLLATASWQEGSMERGVSHESANLSSH